ncbi:MAG: KpsF/GutQ family sugar-phosphate isomerase [Acidobacteria bacterium]|nr:KpsF/GutQ family sugar-phosphate isomerase [Acidobacteriota bacterium]MBI3263918.1 KpsF/GutQ family sugar-phosphate isomerase [Acidobacteriota bacterium]
MTTTTIDLSLARRVLQTEAQAILALMDRLDHRFGEAVQLLHDCRGRAIVTGMGKSGIICRKIAATLSSTGTPAFFLHPAEAVHGDLGVIRSDDVVIALSYSGETDELLRLLETIKRLGARLIAITGSPDSTLGQAADVALDCRVSEEACPLNLVPTASTTAALALGDAIAMTLLVQRGFRQEDFVDLHPGGKLGKRLLRVEHLMHKGSATPIVQTTMPMSEVVYEMSRKGLGMTCVVDEGQHLAGIITDGDLRRHMSVHPEIMTMAAGDVMTRNPVTIGRSMLAVEALGIMEQRKITSLVVADQNRLVEGVLHLHDLWRTQMF